MYIVDTICFDVSLLFSVTTGRHSFLYKLIITQKFGVTAMLLRSLKQVFWKKFVFYIHYFRNNITMLLIDRLCTTSQPFVNMMPRILVGKTFDLPVRVTKRWKEVTKIYFYFWEIKLVNEILHFIILANSTFFINNHLFL